MLINYEEDHYGGKSLYMTRFNIDNHIPRIKEEVQIFISDRDMVVVYVVVNVITSFTENQVFVILEEKSE